MQYIGKVAYLLKLGYEGLQLGAEFFADITTLVSIVSTFYAEAVDCMSGSYSEVSEWSKEADETVTFINTNSHKINEMQLEIKQTQTIAESLNYHYNETLKLIQEVGGLSENLLYSVDSNLPQAINQSSVEIEKLVAEKEGEEEEVDYAVLTGDWVDKIDKSVQVAVPVVTTVVPRMPKAIEFAKRRLGNLKGLHLLSRFKNIKLPTINSKAFNAMSSWFTKAGSFIKEKVGLLRRHITGKYSKALKVVKGLKNGFFILTGYLGGAFNIYNTVKNFRKCEEVKEHTWKALVKVRSAKQLYDEIWKNVTEAKTAIDNAATAMVERLSDDIFLQDLENTKESLFAIQGPNQGLQEMIDTTSQYIEQIKSTTDIMQVHNLMVDLYQNALGSLPFVYKCLIDKTDFVRKVIDNCKKGFESLQQNIATARIFHNFEIKECEKMISVPDLTDDDIMKAVTKASEDEHFNMICPLNNVEALNLICEYHCNGRSIKYMASKLKIDNQQAIKDHVKKCPPCNITKMMKSMICMERNDGSSDESIQEELFPMLTLEQIQQVTCPTK
ncbi:hypothetical protein AC249_AIPGENE20101 [Exaiptasia diaphana]|nr:hypothetical protein AC249_AIPGENE20101 [Exaiptasia diaphana]